MSVNDTYTSPLAERNASPEMLRLWSPRHKFNTWRRIWLAVAEAQQELTTPSEPDAQARVRAQTPTAPNDSSTPLPTDTPGVPVPTLAGASGSEGPACVKPLVTREQVDELRAVVERGITDEEIDAAKKYERQLRHDVMAHVHALGDSCPKAKGIIHLGMTSQDVVCNADQRILNDAIQLARTKIVSTMLAFSHTAMKHLSTPVLGFTHYQPAQPTTVGRRLAMWTHDLFLTFERLDSLRFKYRGFQGATGTQAAWLALAQDPPKVDELNAKALLNFLGSSALSARSIAEYRQQRLALQRDLLARYERRGNLVEAEKARAKIASLTTPDEVSETAEHVRIELDINVFSGPVGQTYPRVIDTFILADLASAAAVLHKIATDIRLLCNRKELDEPFEDKQIGSSAMPYKRNPMRCERICGLTRFVMNLVGNAYDTAATQWLERTLDDSSNRRLSLPEAFLALDGALDLMHNVASGLIVHEAMVKKNLMAELPFMATENILMACVKLGGDRQHYHELIRQHAQTAGLRVKDEGLDNDLLDRLKADRNFWSKARSGPLSAELDWEGVLDPMKYIGRSVEQTERFIKEVVEPLREQYGEAIAKLGDSSPKV